MGVGAYVGWNIGANDTANCVGTSVGCGLISFKNAVILVAIFSILGALLQGQYVMKAISKKTIMTILLGWLLTPTFAAAASFLMYKLIKTVFV